MIWLAIITGTIALISIFGILAPNELDEQIIKATGFPKKEKI